MQLLVIVYVSEMARSVAFYESLGLEREDSREIDDYWNGFTVSQWWQAGPALGDGRPASAPEWPDDTQHRLCGGRVTAAAPRDVCLDRL